MADLLDFGTLEHGRMQLRPQRFDLATLVDELVAASPIAARITVDGPNSLPVDADPAIVERILVNLRGDAAKYAPSGPVTVCYRYRDDRLQLSVADAGPGVPAAEADRIFQPSYRVVDHHPQPGTGIGLALVAEFARVHAGRALVQTNGPGAKFIVEIRPARYERPGQTDDELPSDHDRSIAAEEARSVGSGSAPKSRARHRREARLR